MNVSGGGRSIRRVMISRFRTRHEYAGIALHDRQKRGGDIAEVSGQFVRR
jgi:hypothetical protein